MRVTAKHSAEAALDDARQRRHVVKLSYAH
jgi:hypothetical protein